MPVSSTLTNQLATLGVILPAWPEEPEGDCATEDWIQRGKAYAEGVRLWRAQLRNAPESTKGVLDQLMRHLQDTSALGVWDQLVYGAIKPEVQGSPGYERWQECTKLIRSSAFTPAQLFGIALDLAREQQVEIAAKGMARLIQENEQLETHEKSLLVAEFICALNISHLLVQAKANWRVWNQAISLCQQISALLAVSLIDANTNDFICHPESLKNHELIGILDKIASILPFNIYNTKAKIEEEKCHELRTIEQEDNSSSLERPNSRLKRVKSFNKQYMNDMLVELDTGLILMNFDKFITLSKEVGFTSEVEVKQFDQEIIVVKTYKDSTQLTKAPESFIEESFNNELYALKKLDGELYFPRLIDFSTKNKIIIMNYVGNRLGAKSSEVDVQQVPKNWKQQFYYILTILKKHNLYHNDITERNICINKGILTLIDYGNCKSHVDTYYRNFSREALEKSKNILEFLFQINADAQRIRNCLHGSN